MQIDTAGTVQVQSNLTPDGTMSLDADGMAHLIQVLTNLYADKHLAVLREYSTNARDAHVSVGNPDPIQVSMPSALNPTLVITDHGPGLSKAELLGIYSRYGASTKRNTNTQVGSFGLGSKSAFTITGQFIVTSRKNGQQVSAAFAMDTHGVGTVTIMAEHDTAESNGTTVSIPVSEPYKLQDAAEKFFLPWRPGTVLVDGQEPESFYTADGSLWLGDDILYTRKGGITVVMGSVAYPLPHSAAQTVRSRVGASWPTYGDGAPGLVVFVPIGAVDITPSREGIRDTERSLTAISAVLQTLPARLAAKVSEITATTPDDTARVFASRALLQAAENLRVSVSSALPARIPLQDGAVTLYGQTTRGALRTEDFDVIRPESLHLLTVLVGVPEKRSAKRHAKAWVDENTNRKMLIMVGNGNATEGQIGWFRYGGDSPVATVHFDDIELPQTGGSTGQRSAIVYETSDGMMTPSAILAEGLPVAHGSSYHRSHPALAGYLLVSLNSRQLPEAFARRVPTAVAATDLIQAHNDAALAALGDITELAKGYYRTRQVDQISSVLGRREDQITHPAWTAAKRSTAAYRTLPSRLQVLVRNHSDVSKDDALEALNTALPLLALATSTYGGLSDIQVTHLIAYANAQAV